MVSAGRAPATRREGPPWGRPGRRQGLPLVFRRAGATQPGIEGSLPLATSASGIAARQVRDARDPESGAARRETRKSPTAVRRGRPRRSQPIRSLLNLPTHFRLWAKTPANLTPSRCGVGSAHAFDQRVISGATAASVATRPCSCRTTISSTRLRFGVRRINTTTSTAC